MIKICKRTINEYFHKKITTTVYKLIRGKDQCFWNQLQNHLFQKLETSEYRRTYVYARVYLSLYYAHVCVFIVYLRSMHVHLHTRRLYPLCDISKRTLSQGKKILAGTKCHTSLSIHLHKNISLTRNSKREERQKKTVKRVSSFQSIIPDISR